MKHGLRILAVVPARSGSKGIPDKNLQKLAGKSLIAWAGAVLNSPQCKWIDHRIISTDSPQYAKEGRRHGLDAPFLRPAKLSSDKAGAVETICHALRETERIYRSRYDVILIVEPTCPFRRPADLRAAVDLIVRKKADSIVAVSRVDTKFHPLKVLKVRGGKIEFYSAAGAKIKRRQSLEPLYYRNGACYALTRACLLEKKKIFTESTCAHFIDRPLLNIDEPAELELARYYAEVRGMLPFRRR